jgi:hypothetical protein
MIEWNKCIVYLNIVSPEIGSKVMWLIMDVSFISDGWSHAWNPERRPGRTSQWISTTATTTSQPSRGDGAANRTPQSAGTSIAEPATSTVPRRS